MNITGQLDSEGAKQFAARIGMAYVIAAIGAACGGIATLIWAVHAWWR
ncbi:hypothetical protein [Candidatus Glomeribacter gigasporarum]|nr:hypothetical protein [Candidatus Glomeribacter gigasporarum]